MMNAWSAGRGPGGFGGLNFSSPSAFIGSVLGMFVAAFIIVSVQAMLGKDFSSRGSSRGRGGDAGGIPYVPEVIIT
jgi:hypothetical protein